MKCQNYREQFSLVLNDSLDRSSQNEIESHLANCTECRAEFEAVQKLWNLMGEIPEPEPSEAIRTGFNTMLSDFKEQLVERKNPFKVWINNIFNSLHLQLRPQLAYGLIFAATGLIAGYLLHLPGDKALAYNKQIDSLSSQVAEMKELMMLSLLQNPSASQRIRAVSYTEDISNVNRQVTDALFTTLNEDPNVNVRLATLDALVKFSNEPQVREGLVRSINLQESPLMQSAIADVMVKLQEKSSIPSLQRLLKRKDLNQMVKINVQKNLDKLI